MASEPWPLSFRLTLGAVRAFAPGIIKGLCSTLHIRVINPDLEKQIFARPIIGAVWHNHFLLWAYYFRRRGYITMVSRSRDGELIDGVARRMVFGTVRGSSSKGGSEALVDLIEAAKRGRTVGLPVDGPRGPARVAKIGVIIAARETGHPLHPCVAVAEHAWMARNWDRTVIPFPGSRVALLYGPPALIPKDADREECERHRAQLDERMAALEREATDWLARTRS